MASIHQVRGVLLEEAVLMLLRASGYRTVTESDVGTDPTLGKNSAGLVVIGRGSRHQIDAIGDLRLGQPFSHPQRLLVEAKAYSDGRTIGLPIVRGAVGVLKDVSEFWVPAGSGKPRSRRYHYQGAIFSSTDFTSEAQDYAFAHDVYLLPLARSTFFAPVIAAINAASTSLPVESGQVVGVTLAEVRRQARMRLQPDLVGRVNPLATYAWIEEIVKAASFVGKSLIAVLGQAFPVFLTPRPDLDLDQLATTEQVQVTFEDALTTQGWSIRRTDGEVLFTFDLPDQLFQLYAEDGILGRRSAVALKQAVFSAFTAIYSPADQIRMFSFRLDPGWVESVRSRLRSKPADEEPE